MKFGAVKTDDALGAVLAHSLKTGKLRLKKGRVLGAVDLEALRAAGVSEVIAAQLEPGDVGEDEAATRLADALDAPLVRAGPAATGRVNLFAERSGLFRAESVKVDRFNRIDPAITLATIADHQQVSAGDMVATVKIIPLAVGGASLERAAEAIASPGTMGVRPFDSARVGLVATELPSLKTSVMDKTARLLQERLNASDSTLIEEVRTAHNAEAVGEAVAALKEKSDIIIAFGASAIVDGDDVIPAGIRLAGGVVDHVGMPVDPGNLLVLAHIGDVPVIGAPGCARSPKENGFDWILARILAGERPDSDVITAMGVGGLLKEIPSRPQPRLAGRPTQKEEPPVEIVVLAAGQASRMGVAAGDADRAATPPHKLLAEFDGVPLIRRSCETALASKARAVHVVTGFRGNDMGSALAGLDVSLIDNPDYEEGMASSLRRGVSALSPQARGVLVMLADMPAITSAHLDALIDAFRAAGGNVVVRAASGQVRGNPVVLPRETFDAVMRLEGDVGARQIIASAGLQVIDVDIGDAALVDVDTRQAVLDAGGVLRG
ncbi:molybdopterin-binding/glycosyltransferase family 2 protein [Nitratireductor sp. XY-223]|uniref:NTP transferase domain-containing protein n=1 Tax=Nitratireductor sp. XY-223 TaxID=2561926 RepID=UPI0010A9A472|nr:molybdopterin-binding/glycosyltransferase family 2 protein [Nitratireductor sp. XY-223]